jgi:hypothetical protein
MWSGNKKEKTVEEARKELRALVAKDFVITAKENLDEYDVAVMIRKKDDHKKHMCLKFDDTANKNILSMVTGFIMEGAK